MMQSSAVAASLFAAAAALSAGGGGGGPTPLLARREEGASKKPPLSCSPPPPPPAFRCSPFPVVLTVITDAASADTRGVKEGAEGGDGIVVCEGGGCAKKLTVPMACASVIAASTKLRNWAASVTGRPSKAHTSQPTLTPAASVCPYNSTLSITRPCMTHPNGADRPSITDTTGGGGGENGGGAGERYEGAGTCVGATSPAGAYRFGDDAWRWA
mmetsp:Transcript_25205/g.51826  ORF Transcript_25205/g.51826 Transcript_25205/m.51826 type:complete len:214 (-) Transcript_25205:1057-1698(-)